MDDSPITSLSILSYSTELCAFALSLNVPSLEKGGKKREEGPCNNSLCNNSRCNNSLYQHGNVIFGKSVRKSLKDATVGQQRESKV